MTAASGWEHLASKPIVFFEQVLGLQPSPEQRTILRELAAGSRRKLVCKPVADSILDSASFMCGVALWRAACCATPTVMMGGRRLRALAWANHCVQVAKAARSDFAQMVFSTYAEDKFGVYLINRLWAMTWLPGADVVTDPELWETMRLPEGENFPLPPIELNQCDVLICDFEWVGRPLLHHLEVENKPGLLTLVYGYGAAG